MKYQYLNGCIHDCRVLNLICLLVGAITVVREMEALLKEANARNGRWSAHEQPMMNYMAEGLISFLSAHGTLGDERRLMCCRELTCCLFGWWILGWRAVWHVKMSSKQPRQSLEDTWMNNFLVSYYFKETVTPWNANTAGIFILVEITSQSIIVYTVNKFWDNSCLMSLRRQGSVFNDAHSWCNKPKINAWEQYWSSAFSSSMYTCCHEENDTIDFP